MAQYLSFDEHMPVEEQIKSLGDDELLDFWEETQHLAKMLDQGEMLEDIEYHPDYERMIIQELQVRSCRRGK